MAYTPLNYGYPQFGYQQQFNPYQQQIMQPQQVVQQPQVQQNITQQPTNIINGKIVDCFDVVKSFDVPIGYTYIFPKADGTSIYSKGWMENGTTFVKEYKEVESDLDTGSKNNSINWEEKLNDIYSSIDSINQKIDKIGKSSPTTRKKKVVEEDDDYE